MTLRRWVLGWILLWAPVKLHGQTLDVVDTLSVVPGEPVVCLSHRIVFPSTLHLYAGTEEIAREEYTLDSKSGCLTLYTSLSRLRSGTVTAAYQTLDFQVPSVFQRLPDPWTTQSPSVPTADAPAPKGFTPATEGGLDVSGNQTLGITLGNRRDAKVNQSLDVRIQGQVGTDAQILAILSDQDIPFQPEGNTAELDELDKVLVEFKTPRFKAGLGDIDMQYAGPRFLSFNRKAEGIRGETQWASAGGQVAYGSLKGAFRRSEFFGTDGRQGPYFLESGRSAVVVAGSETVWLDGVQQSRGQDRDYVMDYNRGELTFTSARPITTHSRITVDFEVSQGTYKRNLSFAGTQGLSLGPVGNLEVAYFSEQDDADRALSGDLTPEERSQLRGLGDDAGTVGGGVRYLGPGQGGVYKQILDSATGKTIFVFVDVGGEYAVDFVQVDEGKGDYALDPVNSSESRPVYMHVGDGQGDYVVRRDLPAPRSTQVADVRWGLDGRGGTLKWEGAFSSADQNTLSGLDDGDNQGGAMMVEGALRPVHWGSQLTFTPRVMHRSVGPDFHSPSPYQESFQGWAWNLSATPTAGETVSQVALSSTFTSVVSLEQEVGRLALTDSVEAWRHTHRLVWSDRFAQGRGEWHSVRNTDHTGRRVGHLDRGSADLRWVQWRLQPVVRLLVEDRRFPGAAETTRSREWKAGFTTPVLKNRLTLETLVGRRRDEARPDSTGFWRRDREERSGSVEVKGDLDPVTLAVRYEGRQIERADKTVHHLGRVDVRHRAYQGSWTAQTTWDLGSEAVYRGGKSIVPDSTGYFDRFGNYVGAGGGYDVRYLESQGEPELTSSLNMTSRFRWSPPAEGGPGWLRHVGWDGFVNLREATLESRLGSLLSPTHYLDPDQVLDGNLRSRQTLDLFPTNRILGFKVRHELSRRVYRHRPVEGTPGLLEESRNSEVALSVRYQPAAAWTLEGEGLRGHRQEAVEPETGAAFRQDTDVRSAGLTVGRRFHGSARSGRISTQVAYSTEEGLDRLAEGWRVEPRLQLTFARAGRLDVSGAWKHLSARRGFTALYGPGAPLLTPGWELQLRGDVKLWEGVRLSSTLRHERPEGIDSVTEGRFEVRGTF